VAEDGEVDDDDDDDDAAEEGRSNLVMASIIVWREAGVENGISGAGGGSFEEKGGTKEHKDGVNVGKEGDRGVLDNRDIVLVYVASPEGRGAVHGWQRKALSMRSLVLLSAFGSIVMTILHD